MENFLFFLFLFFIRFGHASGVDCRGILAAFVGEMHKPLVDPRVSYQEPTSFLKEIFESKGTHYSESAIKAFEDDVQDLFPPPKSGESKKWEELGKKWKLNEEQLATVRSYYSFFVFDGAEEMVGKKKDLFAHVKKLTLEYHLEKNEKLKARYEYYQQNLGKKSVPEMAKELGMSQGQVYKELQFYNLSIVEAFGGEYGEGESQASRFVRHYLKQENRGVSWDRWFGADREDALLVQLHDEGLSHAEMAEVLNKLAGVTDPTDTSIRTEASIAAKVKALGLSELNPHKMKDFSIDPYGIVKISGALVPGPATEFLFDNREKGLEWSAEKLGVSKKGLYGFLERQHVEGIFERKKSGELAERKRARGVRKAKSAVEGQENAEVVKEKERNEAIDKLIEWVTKNGGELPDRTKWTEATGVAYMKFFGVGIYSPTSGKKHAEHRLFDGVEQGLKAIKKKVEEAFADDAELKQRVLDEIDKRSKNSQRVLKAAEEREKPKEVQRSEALDKLTASIRKNEGDIPNQSNWFEATGVDYHKFFGFGDYSPTSGKSKKEHRLFDSVEQGLKAIRKKVEEAFADDDPMKQKVLAGIDERVKAAEEREKPIEVQQSEALDKLTASIRNNNGKIPDANSWTEATGVSYSKFFGTKDYSPTSGKSKKEHRLFDSIDEGWKAIRKKAEEAFADDAELRQRVLDEIDRRIKDSQQKLKAAVEREKPIEVQQSEAMDKLIPWIRQNGGSIPNQSNWFEATGVDYHKFFGFGDYSPTSGKSKKEHRLFDSIDEGWKAIRKKAEEAFADDAELKQRVLDEIDKRSKNSQRVLKAAEEREKPKEVQRNEAFDKLIEWVRKNEGDIPNRENWTVATGVDYMKFFGVGDYSPTSRKKQKEYRLFDSVDEGWKAIRKKAEEEFADDDPIKQRVLDEIAERINKSQQKLKAAEKRKQTPKEKGGENASP